MSTIRGDFEALMPEPAAHRYMSHGHSSRWQLAGHAVPPGAEPLYTADQVREAMKAVAERCTKPVPMITTLFEMPGTLLFKSTDGKWFYQNHADTWQSCPAPFAAAIRAQTGGEGND